MNKKTKLLSIFLLAGVISTGVAMGVTGCKKHQWSETYSVQEDGKHAITCGDCDKLKDVHDAVWTDEKDTQCDHEGCTITRTVNLEVAADVTGLIMEGVATEEIQLNNTDKKSYTINKGDIKVYFAKGEEKGTEVPAENLELELKDGSGAAVSSWENITKGDAYKVNAKLKNAVMASGATVAIEDIKTTKTVTIINDVASIALKTGATLTQVQSATDSMSPTWKFEATYQNGDKAEIAKEQLTMGSIDFLTVGENKTLDVSYRVDADTVVTTTVTYSVTENTNIHFESTGYVFGKDDLVSSVPEGQVYKQLGTTTEILTPSGDKDKVQEHSTKAEESELTENEVTRKFYYRYAFGGGTFNGGGATNVNNRVLDVTTTGAGLITVYFATNGNADADKYWNDAAGNAEGRGVAVYSGTMGATYADCHSLGRAVVADKGVHKLQVAVPAAGTYHIGTANNKDCYIFGIQIDTIKETAGADVALPTTTVDTAIEAMVDDTVDETEVKKVLTVGGKFASWVTGIKKVAWNPVSAVVSRTDASADELATATYKINGTAATTETDITTAMLGNAEITVKLGDFEDKYTARVETEVAGVSGITAALKSTVKTQVANDSAKFTLTKDMIDVKTIETVTGAAVDASSIVVKYDATADETDNPTDIGAGVQLGKGDHKIIVEATVTKDGVTTSTLTATVTVSVTKAPDGAYVETTVNLGGAVIKNADGTAVTIGSNGKTPEADVTYDLYSGETKTIVSLAGKKTWKPNANYMQADGGDRVLKIDLTAYAGTNVNIKITVCSAKDTAQNTTKIQLGEGTPVDVVANDVDGASSNVIAFNAVEGGSVVEIKNTGTGARYYKVVITPVG